jgi:hypothetical protein
MRPNLEPGMRRKPNRRLNNDDDDDNFPILGPGVATLSRPIVT